MSRVVVTGIGMVTPLGKQCAEVLEGIKNSRCESEKSRDMMQAIELLLAAEAKDYNPDDYFDKKRTEAGLDSLGIIAGRRAWKMLISQGKALVK